MGEKVTPKSWFKKLTSKQLSGLKGYTGYNYNPINEYLRGIKSTISKGLKEEISHISSALKDAKLKENITVHRGVNIEALGKNFNPANYKKMKGAIIKDKGFMSTSLVPKSAFGGDVHIEIRARKGTHGVFVKPISNHPSENEVLFNKGTKMKIIDIIKNKDNEYNIKAEIV